MRYVNERYGGSEFAPFGRIGRHVAQAAGSAPALSARVGLSVTAAVSAVKSVAEAAIRDWTCRIQFKKYELRQSFVILIFLGNVPEDSSQWRTSPTFVGSHVAFVNSAAERCANCREQVDLVCEGFVHLNVVISRRSGFSSFEPNLVTPYLRTGLQWRLQGVRSFFSTN
jgi:tyrosinase